MSETQRDSPEESSSAIHLFISGRVQGVGYRAWFQSKAVKLGLRGWVRNLRDGRVEAFVRGPLEALQELVENCYKGPLLASVKEIERQEVSSDPLGAAARDGVQILETA